MSSYQITQHAIPARSGEEDAGRLRRPAATPLTNCEWHTSVEISTCLQAAAPRRNALPVGVYAQELRNRESLATSWRCLTTRQSSLTLRQIPVKSTKRISHLEEDVSSKRWFREFTTLDLTSRLLGSSDSIPLMIKNSELKYYELIKNGLFKKDDFVRPVPVRRSDF